MLSIEEVATTYGIDIREARRISKVLRAEEAGWDDAKGASKSIELARAVWEFWEENSYRDKLKQHARRWFHVVKYGKQAGLGESEAIAWFKFEQQRFDRTGVMPPLEFLKLSALQLGLEEDLESTWVRLKKARIKRRRSGGDPNKQRRRAAGLELKNGVRAQVLREEGKMCRYCGVESGNPHVDHIFRQLGSMRANLTVACPDCNTSKGSMNPRDWAARQGPNFSKRLSSLLNERDMTEPPRSVQPLRSTTYGETLW